jgi:hypothetical protein
MDREGRDWVQTQMVKNRALRSGALRSIELKYPTDVTLNSFQGLRDSELDPEFISGQGSE